MTQQPTSTLWHGQVARTDSRVVSRGDRAGEVDANAHRLLVRGLIVVGLIGIALIHLVELPDTWRESAGLGALFLMLVIAALVVAGALVHFDVTPLWQLSALIALGPIAGYVLTRSTDVPFDHADVGNWLEPTVLVAMLIEVTVLVLCGYALVRRESRLSAPINRASGRD